MVQVRKIGWSQLALINGTLEYQLGDSILRLQTPRLNDGEWHHASVKWMVGEIWLNLDYGQHELTKNTAIGIQGLNIGKVFVGGTEQGNDGTGQSSVPALHGCIENVRLGGSTDSDLSPSLESSVENGCNNPDSCSVPPATDTQVCPIHSSCNPNWEAHECSCDSGYVGEKCFDVCHLNPCQSKNSTCIRDLGEKYGYKCECNSPLLSGDYCEKEVK